MTKWDDVQEKLKAHIQTISGSSPVLITINVLGPNDVMLKNSRNLKTMRLTYVSQGEQIIYETGSGERKIVSITEPTDEFAVRLLMNITG